MSCLISFSSPAGQIAYYKWIQEKSLAPQACTLTYTHTHTHTHTYRHTHLHTHTDTNNRISLCHLDPQRQHCRGDSQNYCDSGGFGHQPTVWWRKITHFVRMKPGGLTFVDFVIFTVDLSLQDISLNKPLHQFLKITKESTQDTPNMSRAECIAQFRK